MNAGDRVPVDLAQGERDVLWHGLHEWGGPARCTEDLARAMGHNNLDDFRRFQARVMRSIRDGDPLAGPDWRRALLATEIVFASNVVGSGVDWSSTTGITDAETVELLRSLQRKLVKVQG